MRNKWLTPKAKRIKRVDWAIGSKLFYCKYTLINLLEEDSIFIVKLEQLIRDVFNAGAT